MCLFVKSKSNILLLPFFVYYLIETLNIFQSYLNGFRMRVVHFYEWTVARVERHLDAHQRFQPVGIGHAHGPDLEPEASGRRVDVQRVLHHALLAA